jgi:hypothetical protein
VLFDYAISGFWHRFGTGSAKHNNRLLIE